MTLNTELKNVLLLFQTGVQILGVFFEKKIKSSIFLGLSNQMFFTTVKHLLFA